MKLKQLASLAMAALLAASLLAGCGGASSEESTAETASGTGETTGADNVNPVGEYPIVDEPITLSIMGRKDAGAPDWSELEIFQRLSEITNINFEFEVYDSETWTEQKNIALVGGEYGDIILRDDANAITDEETYGPQGIFIDLTDLIDQYAPQHQGHDGRKPGRQGGHDQHGRQDLRSALRIPHRHGAGSYRLFQRRMDEQCGHHQGPRDHR